MSADEASPNRSGKWSDLKPRLATGAVLTVIAAIAIWLGGFWFQIFVGAIVGFVIWELATMIGARAAIPLAILASVCCMAMAQLPAGFGLPLALLPALVGASLMEREQLTYAIYSPLIILAGFGLIHLRVEFGSLWLVWFLLVVVVTDIGGYFAGRTIGGPKFWPRISPKKTWAGTIAGWIAAAIVGICFVVWRGAPGSLVAVSVALSMASQMGDIAESALKRRVGIKDSSNLLPGHGGFFDRFDGVLGAAVFLLLVEQIVLLPAETG